MQASLYMIVILVVFQSFTLASNLATESPGMEITPRQKESLEKSILSLLGLTKRPPPVDPSKIVIPDSMRQRYDDRMRDNRETPVNFQRPGLYTRSADTVRSFTHTGTIIVAIKLQLQCMYKNTNTWPHSLGFPAGNLVCVLAYGHKRQHVLQIQVDNNRDFPFVFLFFSGF